MNLNTQNTSRVYQKQELNKIAKEFRPKNIGKMKINNTDRYGSIGSVSPKKEELNIPTKNMILALIDSEKVKKKTNLPLNANNNHFNKYYMLNLDWLLSYNNLEKIVNNNYTSPNEKLIIEKAISYIDSKYKNKIK